MEKKKNKAGRPTVITPETSAILEEEFQKDSTITDACHYAGIDQSTYSRHIKKDKDFARKMDMAQNYTKRNVRSLISKDIVKGRIETAKWYAPRKMFDEYGDKSRSEITGLKGEPVEIKIIEDTELRDVNE